MANQIQRMVAFSALAVLAGVGVSGSACAQQLESQMDLQPLGVRWEANLQAKPKAPQLVGKALTITCKVTLNPGTTTGVVLAQGGDQRGYSLYLKDGKPNFVVRQKGKLYSAKGSKVVKGVFSMEAHLKKDGMMTLAVNGSSVASGKAPGVFALQPKDGLSIGADTMSAVGDYKAPNTLKGKVESVKVVAQ